MTREPKGEANAPAPVNVFTADNAGGRVDVGHAAGSETTAMYLYDLAPGQSSCPYHYEYEEEWLLVVEGSVVIRVADGERTLERGDVVCFPAGPRGAHKIMNRSDAPARTLVFSAARLPAISVYPDSDKIGIWTGDGANDDLFFRRETGVAWSHGEEGWNRAD
jgi:uncharacterized cupin superfamily protein